MLFSLISVGLLEALMKTLFFGQFVYVILGSSVNLQSIQKSNVMLTFSSRIFPLNIPKIPQKPKVILMKSTFWRTPKRHVFPTFSEMSRLDVDFTDSDSVTA